MAFAGSPVIYKDGVVKLTDGTWSYAVAGTQFTGYAILEAYTPNKDTDTTLAGVANRAQNDVPADMAGINLAREAPRQETNRVEYDSVTDLAYVDFADAQQIGGAVISDGTNLLCAIALSAAQTTTASSDLTIQIGADGIMALPI